MPTYQYRCAKCGEEFELWQSIHDDALTRHPGCGGAVTRVFAPAGIVLKGSGFYRTDSRAGAGKRADGAKNKEPAKEGAASGNGSGDGAKSSPDSKASTGSNQSQDAKKEAKPSSKSGSSST